MVPPPRSVKRAVAAALVLWPAAALAAGIGDLRPGARPAAMGQAYTALSDDVWGLFHNPAGLARSPFPQAGFTLGRLLSPVAPLFYHAWAYSRPFPVRPGSTVGAGFLGAQQSPGFETKGERNELVLHYSEAFTLPQFYITKPFNAGANLKIAQGKPRGKGSKLGLGLDAGVLFEAPRDVRLGAVVSDLNTGLGFPAPALSFGSAWTWQRRLTFAADLRVRSGLTQFTPAVEWSLFQRLLKLRAAEAFRLDGSGALALGVGVDYSPLTLDFTVNVPVSGLNRDGGAYILSAAWRFGAPEFHGRFVGSAARRAEDLRSEIQELERRRQDEAARARAAQSDHESLEGQVRAEEERLRRLQEDSRVLETELERRRYDLGHPPPEPVKPPAPPPAPKPVIRSAPRRAAPALPARHVVRPGDTLRRLAEIYYGDPSRWELIYDANPDKVERGLPVEGTTLLIPRRR